MSRTHGKRSTYYTGCRCDPCTQAASTFMRNRRKKLAALKMPDDKHGKPSGYTDWSCRCDQCREASLTSVYRQRKTWFAELKSVGCTECGTTEGQLDFDHKDPRTKNFSIARAWAKPIPALETEIALCDIRCRPCHMRRTAQQRKDGYFTKAQVDALA